MKFSNATGLIVQARQYHVPPLRRLRLCHVLIFRREEPAGEPAVTVWGI